MDLKEEVLEALCQIIEQALPESQRNTPNFSVGGQDMIALNFSPRHPVRIVFHRGATAKDKKTGARLVDDEGRLLTWATDQRANASFPDTAFVSRHADWLAKTCRTWVAAACD